VARAHARTGDRIAIAAYLGDDDALDRVMVEFSERYADRNERDVELVGEAARTAGSPCAAASEDVGGAWKGPHSARVKPIRRSAMTMR
jgi:hypothetical protein